MTTIATATPSHPSSHHHNDIHTTTSQPSPQRHIITITITPSQSAPVPDLKQQRNGIQRPLTWGNDVTGAAVAISELRGDGEAVLVTWAHVHQALVPALDHLADAQLEGEWLVPVHAGRGKRSSETEEIYSLLI